MRVSCSAMDILDDLIGPYGDRELDDVARAAVNAHVDRCAPCREKLYWELGALMHLRARLTPPPAPPSLRAKIHRALNQADRQQRRLWLF